MVVTDQSDREEDRSQGQKMGMAFKAMYKNLSKDLRMQFSIIVLQSMFSSISPAEETS